jgi:hypothetical protein
MPARFLVFLFDCIVALVVFVPIVHSVLVVKLLVIEFQFPSHLLFGPFLRPCFVWISRRFRISGVDEPCVSVSLSFSFSVFISLLLVILLVPFIVELMILSLSLALL